MATDRADYPPGSTVSISGTGFQPGETVRLQVLRIDLPENDGPEHQPWEVTANDKGDIQTTWLVTPDEVGATLQLTATGLASGLIAQTIFTDGAITPASGGEAVSADTCGGTYTALTGPVLAETIVGDISLGTIVLTVPAGFVFDTNPPLPVITLTGDNNHKNINGLANGDTIALTVTTNSLAFTVTTKSRGQTRNVLTYSNIRVCPTAPFPLASGNITNTGTSTFPNSTANFGTLTEVAGGTNRPPSLPGLADFIIAPGQLLSFNVDASDPNSDDFSFSLDPGAPAGAVVTSRVFRFPEPATNTVFRWRPTRDQASTTNLITLRVTDDGMPPMSAARTFTVAVLDYVEVSIGSTNVQCDHTVAVPIYLASSDGVTNLDFTIRWPSAWLSNATLTALSPAVGSATLQNQGANLALAIRAAPGQVLQGAQQVAWLSFAAISNEFSTFAQLPLDNATALKSNGSPYDNYILHAATIAVVEGQPLLRASLSSNATRNLTLYGRLGTNYHLQYSADLALPNAWELQWNYVQTNGAITISVDPVPPVIFYRIFQP